MHAGESRPTAGSKEKGASFALQHILKGVLCSHHHHHPQHKSSSSSALQCRPHQHPADLWLAAGDLAGIRSAVMCIYAISQAFRIGNISSRTRLLLPMTRDQIPAFSACYAGVYEIPAAQPASWHRQKRSCKNELKQVKRPATAVQGASPRACPFEKAR